MRNQQNFFATVYDNIITFFTDAYDSVYTIFICGCTFLWCINISKLISDFNDPLTMLQAFRIVGVPVFPIGIFLGLI